MPNSTETRGLVVYAPIRRIVRKPVRTWCSTWARGLIRWGGPDLEEVSLSETVVLLAMLDAGAGGGHLEASTSHHLGVSNRIFAVEKGDVQHVHVGERGVGAEIRTARALHPWCRKIFRTRGEDGFRTGAGLDPVFVKDA